jgi:hypothetical protein
MTKSCRIAPRPRQQCADLCCQQRYRCAPKAHKSWAPRQATRGNAGRHSASHAAEQFTTVTVSRSRSGNARRNVAFEAMCSPLVAVRTHTRLALQPPPYHGTYHTEAGPPARLGVTLRRVASLVAEGHPAHSAAGPAAQRASPSTRNSAPASHDARPALATSARPALLPAPAACSASEAAAAAASRSAGTAQASGMLGARGSEDAVTCAHTALALLCEPTVPPDKPVNGFGHESESAGWAVTERDPGRPCCAAPRAPTATSALASSWTLRTQSSGSAGLAGRAAGQADGCAGEMRRAAVPKLSEPACVSGTGAATTGLQGRACISPVSATLDRRLWPHPAPHYVGRRHV